MGQQRALTPLQQQVLDYVTGLYSPTVQVVSGHDIRLLLQASGLDKRSIVVTLGELVQLGRLERVRVTESSGLFYTAYRQTPLA